MNDILKQILDEIQGMKTNMQNMNADISDMKTDMQNMNADISGMKTDMQNMNANISTRFDNIETKFSILQTDVNEIKSIVKRIEENHPEDIHAMLKTINRKLDQRDIDIQVLNKRVFKVEGNTKN